MRCAQRSRAQRPPRRTILRRPVRILVGFPPGGATDLVMRLVQPRLAEAFKQEIIVDNPPGANGVIAADLTAKATSTVPREREGEGGRITARDWTGGVRSSAVRRTPRDRPRGGQPIRLNQSTESAAEATARTAAAAVASAVISVSFLSSTNLAFSVS